VTAHQGVRRRGVHGAVPGGVTAGRPAGVCTGRQRALPGGRAAGGGGQAEGCPGGTVSCGGGLCHHPARTDQLGVGTASVAGPGAICVPGGRHRGGMEGVAEDHCSGLSGEPSSPMRYWDPTGRIWRCSRLAASCRRETALVRGGAAQAAWDPWDQQTLPGLQACAGQDRSSLSFTACSSPVVLLDA